MSMLTITASDSLLRGGAAKPLAPTLANAIAMMGAPKEQQPVRPSVSIASYASLHELFQLVGELDDRFDRSLGVAIELPASLGVQRRRLGRVANPGGRLAIVAPHSRPATADSTDGSRETAISGWDDVRECVSIDEAVQQLLQGGVGIRRCFVLRPEGQDPALVLQAIGRSLMQ